MRAPLSPAWVVLVSVFAAPIALSREPVHVSVRAHTPAEQAASPSRMPGPQPFARGVDASTANAACTHCHADIAAEWATSLHALSDHDPVYRRALAREPLSFCRGCHAPEADPSTDAPPALSAIGVGCVTCHVTERGENPPTRVLAAPASLGDSAPPPHGVLQDPLFATEAACASCHEFDFPDGAWRRTPERMQSTVSEHQESAYATITCSECHMPTVEGPQGRHRSHVFPGARDPEMLRSALTVRVRRPSASRLVVTLASDHVGHAMPTGDLFRRLVVSTEAVGDDWAVVADAQRPLSRRFELAALGQGHTGRVLVGDDRVANQPVDVELDLGDAARGRTIAWRVEYQRVEHPIGTDETKAVVADATVIAEGALGPKETKR